MQNEPHHLEVVVAAMPPEADLAADLMLVKPALLYADRVRILSPVATLLGGVAALGQAEGTERANIIADLVEAMGEPNAVEIRAIVTGMTAVSQLPRAERRRALGGRGSRELRAKMGELDGIWSELGAKVEDILVRAHVSELVPAIEAGLVEVEPLVRQGETFDTDQMLTVFVEKVGSMLMAELVYPLFDDKMGALIEAGVAEGMFTVSAGANDRGRQVGAAAELFNYLPAFPLSTVSDILAIRDDLEGPLVRFRGAMARVARDVTAAPHGEEFRSQIEHVYREEVSPALREIREAVENNAYLRQLLGESARDIPKWLGAGFVALATSPWTHLSEVVSIGMAAAGPVAQAAWRTMTEARQVRQNQYYLLYETNRLLS
jgi:hypothetical protein